MTLSKNRMKDIFWDSINKQSYSYNKDDIPISGYALVQTNYHGGGTISLHKELYIAIMERDAIRKSMDCRCGCVLVICKHGQIYSCYGKGECGCPSLPTDF